MDREKARALVAAEVAKLAPLLSEAHVHLWTLAEPAWREYRSARWYVDALRAESFEVEEGSGGMPTAFVARWGGAGPVLAAHAEYDAVPGQSQAPTPYRAPREGSTPWDAGHTDPHSALGLGGLGGIVAAKRALEVTGLPARLVFFGEPAEKVCGSKVVHAAKGYYDDLEAMISFHPSYLGLNNTVLWETHCGAYWSTIYTFESETPETWQSSVVADRVIYNGAAVARSPGANDALVLFYTLVRFLRPSMLTNSGLWSLNEAILNAGDACADNLPPRASQIQYAWRAPTLEMCAVIERVVDKAADMVADLTNTRLTRTVVARTRVGIGNLALARLVYESFEACGPPRFGFGARAFANEILTGLGVPPMEDPLVDGLEALMPPEEAERFVRSSLPDWQRNYTSDDYVEYTWHCPTARLFVARPMLRQPNGRFRYPDWVRASLGGRPEFMDPMILKASEVIALSLVRLATEPARLKAARAEFEQRTGGIGGANWMAPLLPKDFEPPVGVRWPDYVYGHHGGRRWYAPKPPLPDNSV